MNFLRFIITIRVKWPLFCRGPSQNRKENELQKPGRVLNFFFTNYIQLFYIYVLPAFIFCFKFTGLVNYKKGCTRLAVASDKAYQLFVHGRWFSPNTPASSTTKTGRHDIAEILLKVALKHQISNKIICMGILYSSHGYLQLQYSQTQPEKSL
jgi:hypothetical protein